MLRSQLLATALAFAAAVSSPSHAGEARQVRIVKQPGLAYLPLIVMRELRLFLNCGKATIRSLKDLGPNDRIALPAIGSVQHNILQMEADKELGDPRKLDRQVVAMAHEDATAALLSHREITCHLSGPPYQYEQLRNPGIV